MYQLTLTDDDVRTIAHVGWAYEWARALWGFTSGEHNISETEAWAIAEAFEADCEGGHSPFPMLDPNSELAARLHTFWGSLV